MQFERWLYILNLRLRSLFRRGRVERELEDELRYHLELRVEANISRGMTSDEARREAIRAMDGIEQRKEECRDMRKVNLIDNVSYDLRYAIRMLWRNPGFTTVVVLSLALGIGANLAVFTLVNALFLRTLPVPDPYELVAVTSEGTGLISFPMYRDLRDQQKVFTGMFASGGEMSHRITIRYGSGESIELDNVRVSAVTANYFDVLALQPAIGRFLTTDDERIPESAESLGSVVVLSHAFWERQFGADPGILNQTIRIGRSECRVVGVAPRGFSSDSLGNAPMGWIPLEAFYPADDLENRLGRVTVQMARLKPGVTMEAAQSAMTLLFRGLTEAEGIQRRSSGESRIVLSAADNGFGDYLRQTYAKPLWIIMAIVAFVLMIACANIANLLLARSGSRRNEIGVRLAIGCNRWRLICQLLTESLLLALLGAGAGSVLAYWGSRTLVQMVNAPLLLDLTPDATVVAFMVAITSLTTIGFGLVPALRATRSIVSPVANTVRGESGSVGRQLLSRGLVVIQVSLSLLLLIGSGLLIRSFSNLHELEWGFRPENVVIFDLAHNPQRRDPASLAQSIDQLWHRLKDVPGVESVSLAGILIFSGSDIGSPLVIPDYAALQGERPVARFNSVSPGYFETVGMTLLQGRTLEERDGSNDPVVAVVNESMARKFFQGSPIGKLMYLAGGGPTKDKPIQIVGMVRDAKYNDLRAETKPMFYMTLSQFPRSLRSIEVRTREPLATIAPRIRQSVAEVTKDVMIRRVVSLTEQVDLSLNSERLIMRLCSFFGVLALLLSCLGLYGLVSYAVNRRTNEIRIRITLGATQRSVVWMVMNETWRIVIVGLLIGVALALAFTQILSSFLFGLTATDTRTIATAIVILTIAAGIAAYLPARRASKVDPMIALRHE